MGRDQLSTRVSNSRCPRPDSMSRLPITAQLPWKEESGIRLVTKVSCSALSQRSCQTPGSSATQSRQLRYSALHLQPPQRWYFIKRCLVSSAAASSMTDLLHSYLPSHLLLPTCATDRLHVHSPLLPVNSRLHDCQMRQLFEPPIICACVDIR
jgi:hypothetical protein